MPHEFNLQEYRTVSNSGVLYKDSVPADIGIRIIPLREEGRFDFTLFGPLVTDPDLNQHGTSDRNALEIIALVEECRAKWNSAVVQLQRTTEADGRTKFEFPFQDAWDFQADAAILDNIGPSLARAGEDLFASIFDNRCDDGLKEIGQTIRSALSSGDRYIAITSNQFFLPWGMLYTHPVQGTKLQGDGSNWEKSGFWGYRHIVQQTTEKYRLENGIRPDAAGMIPSSINFDDRLSKTLELPVIDAHIQFVRDLGAKVSRTRKSQLAADFSQNRQTLERIIYFYCHGSGSGGGASTKPASLQLSDAADFVSAFDFERWSNGEMLPTNPLVFINACQGGQMSTIFYKSFAVELLKEGAVGLIGAQIDVPAVFAVEYAKEIFTRFFARTTDKVRLGPLMRDVNRTLWDVNHNPLGLVYSLYRGVDCFIDWPNAAGSDNPG